MQIASDYTPERGGSKGSGKFFQKYLTVPDCGVRGTCGASVPQQAPGAEAAR